jgi:hypothetical protein
VLTVPYYLIKGNVSRNPRYRFFDCEPVNINFQGVVDYINDDLVPYTGAISDVDLGLFDLSATDITARGLLNLRTGSTVGPVLSYSTAGDTNTGRALTGGDVMVDYAGGNALCYYTPNSFGVGASGAGISLFFISQSNVDTGNTTYKNGSSWTANTNGNRTMQTGWTVATSLVAAGVTESGILRGAYFQVVSGDASGTYTGTLAGMQAFRAAYGGYAGQTVTLVQGIKLEPDRTGPSGTWVDIDIATHVGASAPATALWGIRSLHATSHYLRSPATAFGLMVSDAATATAPTGLIECRTDVAQPNFVARCPTGATVFPGIQFFRGSLAGFDVLMCGIDATGAIAPTTTDVYRGLYLYGTGGTWKTPNSGRVLIQSTGRVHSLLDVGTMPTLNAGTAFVGRNNSAAGDNMGLSLISGAGATDNGFGIINFGTSATESLAWIKYFHASATKASTMQFNAVAIHEFLINANAKFTINNTALTATVPHYLPAGTAAAPALTWTSDTTTGLHLYGGFNAFAASVAGADTVLFKADQTEFIFDIVADDEIKMLTDAKYLICGASSDLQIGHTGSVGLINQYTNFPLQFNVNNTLAGYLTATQLTIGNVTSVASTGINAQIGGSCFLGYLDNGANLYLTSAIYYAGGFKYTGNAKGTLLDISAGEYSFYTAPLNAGGAGAACTITKRFFIGNTGEVEAAKVRITTTGGIAVKLTNKTGGNTVAGHVVRVDSAATSAVVKTIDTVPDPIGVFYESGIADGAEAWVVVSGIADVYFVGSTTRGHLARTFTSGEAGYVTGQALSEAVPSSPFATDKHFCEIGHVIEARTGAGTAKVVLHFN